MQKVLVTGGAGFIGSHVADELIERGYKVTILDDLSGGFKENVNPKAEFVQGSIVDHSLIDQLFNKENFDFVYHLAAYAAEGLSHFIKRFNYNNNLIGSINLINAAVNHNIKCFVFTSSIAVYGSSPTLPMTEEIIPHPEDSYGIAKFAIEQELIACKEMFDLNYIIFRPHNVYGERQNVGDKYRNVVGIFMNQILQNKPMSVFGDGEQTRAFSYIGDMAPVMAEAIENKAAYNQIFNIGADQPYTINQLVQSVAKAMKTDPMIKNLPPRNEVQDAYSSHKKLESVFGTKEGHSLDEGLENMARWVRRHGSRQSSKFENIEITKNFPEAWRN